MFRRRLTCAGGGCGGLVGRPPRERTLLLLPRRAAAFAGGRDRWRSEQGELQYRLLAYPQRAYFVVLMGPDRDNAHYIGALDANWHVVHHVALAGGGSTASLLRALPRF